MELFWIVMWMVVCYLYAKGVHEKYPKMDINPNLYLIGGALFGVFSLCWAWVRKREYEKYNN